jgi:glycosyltransferase involved in cell wall biosynthesis
MKILLINNYHFIKGGSETVYLNTGKLLESKGHEVIYFSSTNDNNLLHGKNNLFVESKYSTEMSFIGKVKGIPNFIYSKSAFHNLEKLIIREKPDIAHLHIFYGVLTSSILKVLKKRGIPCVMSIHEYRLLCPTYTFLNSKNEICEKCANGNKFNCIINKCNKNSLPNSIISAIETYYRDFFFSHLKYIKHFIMVSNFIREKHIEYNGAYREKSSVIYNFHSIFTSSIVKLSDKKCDLVYFGRLSKEKGIITLIKSLENKPEITLNIVGTGPEEKRIKDYIKSKKIKNISLLGYLSGENLWSIVQSARYTVVPSEWYENNPMNVIESLLLGTPVIGANIGGIPEIVKKPHGFIFESKSIDDLSRAIDEAISINEEGYKLLCSNAIEFANQQFSENIHYQNLIKVYNSLKTQNPN